MYKYELYSSVEVLVLPVIMIIVIACMLEGYIIDNYIRNIIANWCNKESDIYGKLYNPNFNKIGVTDYIKCLRR